MLRINKQGTSQQVPHASRKYKPFQCTLFHSLDFIITFGLFL